MEKVNAKLLNYASILDENTLEQAKRTASMPFIFPHVALMPDAHLGKGSTVGSVIPTSGAIIPAAVGVDIGCGMMAVRTQFTKTGLLARGNLSDLRESIEKSIPLSAGKYNNFMMSSAESYCGELTYLADALNVPVNITAPNWWYQLGSLGSGNHFIEISIDEMERVWIFLHSGSRGIGNKLAQEHIKVAQEYCERHFISLPDKDLAYLIEGTKEFDRYMHALEWAQEFAKYNRIEMMNRVETALTTFMGSRVQRHEQVNCHHNYTTKEHHFSKNLWISRKGAIDAHEGIRGLIPGSMGDKSYVVTGLGNKPSLCTAPHGAGRVYSRSAAKKTFTVQDLESRMEGIEYRKTDAFIDEIPDAYKNIDVVMEDAKELVRIDHTLRQLVNVKGD